MSDKIKGLELQGETFKIQAFADDLLILVENSKASIEALMMELQDYDEMAVLKINHKKIKILTKNKQKRRQRNNYKSQTFRRKEK